MSLDAVFEMLANGWPLALAGFLLGALTGAFLPRSENGPEATIKRMAPDGDGLAALASELATAKELLDAEEAETGEMAENLKDLDHAIKRANGRLKLIMKAVKRAK
ncbi:hypothetical protein [Hyphococcus sp. DH-69]|uniref:hypothetical protein n=1 Tax=Hyphococcus formosus TaxID=3143534 RepID=UPI00398A867B